MEDCMYIVNVKIGRQLRFEFEGTLISYEVEKSIYTFGESDENLIPKKNGDMVVLDLERKSVAFRNGHLSIVMDVLGQKKVDDNYYFKCATDLFRVDVYICNKELWKEQGEFIFA